VAGVNGAVEAGGYFNGTLTAGTEPDYKSKDSGDRRREGKQHSYVTPLPLGDGARVFRRCP